LTSNECHRIVNVTPPQKNQQLIESTIQINHLINGPTEIATLHRFIAVWKTIPGGRVMRYKHGRHTLNFFGAGPNCLLPTLVVQKSEQKSIEEQADENFEIRTITVILAL